MKCKIQGVSPVSDSWWNSIVCLFEIIEFFLFFFQSIILDKFWDRIFVREIVAATYDLKIYKIYKDNTRIFQESSYLSGGSIFNIFLLFSRSL